MNLEHGPQWSARIERLRDEARSANSPKRAARHWVDAGRLLEVAAGDVVGAEQAYRAALAADSMDVASTRHLRRLLERTGRWEEVETLLLREAEQTESAGDRGGLYLRLGTLLMERLGRIDDAREALRLAAEAQPSDDEILIRLELLTPADDTEARVDLLERRLRSASQPEVRARLHRDIARHLADDPQTEAAALAHLRDALSAMPGEREALLDFIRLHLRLGRVADLIAALSQMSASVTDPAFRGRLLFLVARLGLSRTETPERVAPLLDQLVGLLDDEPGFGRSLVADLESIGRWAQANAVLLRLAESESDVRAAELLYRAALNAEVGLADEAEATRLLTAAVERDPRAQPAWLALRRLAWRGQSLGAWLQALETSTEAVVDPAVRAAWLGLAARALETLSGDKDAALAKWHAAQAAALQAPGALADMDAVEQTQRLLGALGEHAQAHQLVEAWLAADVVPEVRRQLLSDAATLLEVHLDQPRAATRAVNQLLDESPGDLGALRALERLTAAAGDIQGFIAATEREIVAVSDGGQQLALLARNAELHEELGDPRRAEDCWRRALALSPRFLPALAGLGRIFYHHGRWHDLAALHRHELTQLVGETSERISVLGRLAEVYEFRLEQPDDAAACYEELLTLRPRAPDALAGLERLYAARDRWADLARVLASRIEHTDDLRERAALLARLSELQLEHLDDRESALDNAEAAMALAPGLVSLPWTLERLLSGLSDRAREVMALRTLLARTGQGGHRLMLAHKLASALAPADARAVYEEIALAKPDDFVAHWALFRDAFENGDHRRACDALARVAQCVTDRRDARLLWREAAEHAEAAALEQDAQRALWTRVVELEPDDPVGHGALHRLYRRGDDADAWVAWLLGRAGASGDERSAAIALWLGGLEADARGGADPVSLWRKSADLAVDDPTATWLLCDRAERAGQAALASELLVELAHRRVNPHAASQGLTAAGLYFADVSGDQARAVACWLEAVRRDPDADEASGHLERLYSAAGQFSDWAALLQRRARRMGQVAGLGPLLNRLLDLQMGPLADFEAAQQTVTRLGSLEPENRAVRQRAVEVFSRLGDWTAAGDALERLLPECVSDEERAGILTQLGIIRARHDGRLDDALELLRRAIGLMAPDGRAHEELAAVHLVRGEPGPALTAYERLERLTTDPIRVEQARRGQVRALVALGRFAEARERLDAFRSPGGDAQAWRDLEESLSALEPSRATSEAIATVTDLRKLTLESAAFEPDVADELQVEHLNDVEIESIRPPPVVEPPVDLRKTEPYGLPVVQFEPRAPTAPPPPPNRSVAAAVRATLSEAVQSTSWGRPATRPGGSPPLPEGDSAARAARVRIEAEPLDAHAWQALEAALLTEGQVAGATWSNDVLQWLQGVVLAGRPTDRISPMPEELKRGLLPSTVPAAVAQLFRATSAWVTAPFCVDAARHGVTAQDLVDDADPLHAMARRHCDVLGLEPVLLLRNPSRPYTTAIEAGDPSSVVLGSAILDGAADTARSFLLARSLVPLAEGTLLARKFTDREFGAFLAALLGLLGADLPVRARDRATYDRMRAQLEPALPQHRRTPALVELARNAALQMQMLAPAALRAGFETYTARLAFLLGDGAGGAFEMVRRLDFDDRPRTALTRADLVQFVSDSDVARDLLLFAASPQAVAVRAWLGGAP